MIEMCPNCKGTGSEREAYEEEGNHGRMGTYYRNMTCSVCEGTGLVEKFIKYKPFKPFGVES